MSSESAFFFVLQLLCRSLWGGLLLGLLLLPGVCRAQEYNDPRPFSDREGNEPLFVSAEPERVVTPSPPSADHGRTTRKVGFAEAIDRALEENVDFALARAERRIAEARKQGAHWALLPSLELGGGVGTVDGRVQGSFGELRDVEFDTYQGTSALVYRLNLGAQIQEALAENHELREAGYRVSSSRQRLLLRVTELYQNLILAKSGWQIAEELEDGSETLVRIVSVRQKSGITPASELERARAKLAMDRRQVVQAWNLWARVSAQLVAVLALDPKVILDPEMKKWEPDVASWGSGDVGEQEGPEENPALTASKQNVDAALRRRSAAVWELLSPQLRGEARGTLLDDGLDDFDGQRRLGLSLTWEWSLEKLARMRRTKAEEEAAQLRLRRTREELASEIQIAREDLENARKQIPLAHESLQAAEATLRMTLVRYRSGTAIMLEVLDAEDALGRARLDLARSMASYHIARARLLAAAGRIDRDSLLGSSAEGPHNDTGSDSAEDGSD